MKNFISNQRYASTLTVDDWFKMGGFLYRVQAISQSGMDIELVCYPVYNPHKRMTLYVDPKAIIKTYNQK